MAIFLRRRQQVIVFQRDGQMWICMRVARIYRGIPRGSLAEDWRELIGRTAQNRGSVTALSLDNHRTASFHLQRNGSKSVDHSKHFPAISYLLLCGVFLTHTMIRATSKPISVLNRQAITRTAAVLHPNHFSSSARQHAEIELEIDGKKVTVEQGSALIQA